MQVYTKLSDYRVPHHDRWWNRYAPSSRQGLKTFAKQSRDIDDALSDDDYYLSLLPKDIRSHIYEYLVLHKLQRILIKLRNLPFA